MTAPRRPISLLSIMLLFGLSLSVWLQFTAEPEKVDKQIMVTCFMGNELFYAGPVKKRPVVDGNSIIIEITDSGTTLEFLNGTCAVLSSPD